MKFERLGCFKYSHEENTHAYNLVDDVTEIVKNKDVWRKSCLFKKKSLEN